jgi:1-acyl-sn-glycerol-3-phosphate acyltransferase
MSWFYYFSKFLIKRFFLIFWGFTVEGKKNVPSTGGFILAPNHVSFLDPPVVGSACPRKVYFLAKIELFSVPLLSFWMKEVGVMPLYHSAHDKSSLKKAVELLKSGECVCIFPEGGRVPPGITKPAEPGISFIAKLANVPVVPAAILGTQPWNRKILGFIPWFSRLKVRFGPPIAMDFSKETNHKERESFQKNADFILKKINELKSDKLRQN